MSTTVPAAMQAPSGGGRLAGAVASEWTKLRSVRSTWWALVGAAALAAVMVPVVGFTLANNTSQPGGPPAIPVGEVVGLGATVVQFVVATLAILAITDEYSTGTIHPTFQAVPLRGRLLAAKAIVVAAVTLPAGVVLGVIITTLADYSLGDKGIAPDGGLVRMALAISLEFTLVSLLALGVAVLVRRTAGALTIVFVVLIGIPAAADLLSLDDLAELLPARAGSQLISGATDPYGPLAGALLLAAWVVAVNVAAWLTLRTRDA